MRRAISLHVWILPEVTQGGRDQAGRRYPPRETQPERPSPRPGEARGADGFPGVEDLIEGRTGVLDGRVRVVLFVRRGRFRWGSLGGFSRPPPPDGGRLGRRTFRRRRLVGRLALGLRPLDGQAVDVAGLAAVAAEAVLAGEQSPLLKHADLTAHVALSHAGDLGERLELGPGLAFGVGVVGQSHQHGLGGDRQAADAAGPVAGFEAHFAPRERPDFGLRRPAKPLISLGPKTGCFASKSLNSLCSHGPANPCTPVRFRTGLRHFSNT